MLASFGQIELKNLEIRQYSGGFFVQFASKSDCAIWALDLISASIIDNFGAGEKRIAEIASVFK